MNSVNNIQVVDVEASGLHPDSYPIEVGIFDLADPAKRISFYIKPEPQWTHWDYNAELIHGLSREQINEFGISVTEACERINAVCDSVMVSDAPGFDANWLSVLYDAANMTPSFDIVGIETVVPWDKFSNCVSYLAQQHRPHRALADAEIIARAIAQYMHK
jgi:hypothetical protein